MKTLNIGDKVITHKSGPFKGIQAEITMIGIFDGLKRYQITTDQGLIGWFANKELLKYVPRPE